MLSFPTLLRWLTGLLTLTLMVTAPRADDADAVAPVIILKHDRVVPFEEFIDELTRARVVLVGETHDRLDHHLNQLRVIEALHRSNPDLAIGLEFFQRPFQRYLDRFIQGTIDTNEMLRRTEYFDRWQYDFRLYEPIMRFARQQGIPLVALNAPAEVVRTVGTSGLAALNDEERAGIAQEIDRSDDAYRDRLRAWFAEHPSIPHGNFERFYEVQLVWDETMAATAVDYLRRFPDRRMVILAGNGHIEYGSGVPVRLVRRGTQPVISVVNEYVGVDDPNIADFRIRSRATSLPNAGLLGVFVEPSTDEARIEDFAEDSAAKSAGVERGDVIVAVNDEPVSRYGELRAALWDKLPGDRVSLRVLRGDHESRQFEVVLR